VSYEEDWHDSISSYANQERMGKKEAKHIRKGEGIELWLKKQQILQ